jgi:hypothetical protein
MDLLKNLIINIVHALKHIKVKEDKIIIMKSTQTQYNELREGNMSQANFMRNIRMTFPHLVTNVTNFDDSVKILKNKGLISETKTDDSHLYNPVEVDLGLKIEVAKHEGDIEKAKKIIYANLKKNSSYYSQLKLSGHSTEPKKTKKPSARKKKDANIDAVNGMKKVKDIVKENLDTEKVYGGTGQNQGDTGSSLQFTVTENTPEYFEIDFTLTPNSKYRQAGAGSRSPREKEYGYVKISKKDFNGQITVKGENFNIGKDFITTNLQENVDEKMYFADMPADPEKYKIVKDSKGYIIKATNADGVEFQKGDVVKTYDGEEIKIAKFEESQGKVKAIYSTGMFYRGIDIDGLEAPKETMRPGVDMGKSFEKFKATLEQIVREVVNEESNK